MTTFSPCPQVADRKHADSLMSLLIKALIPPRGPPLTTSPRPRLQIPLHWWRGFNENLGGTVHSRAPLLSFFSSTLTSQFLKHDTLIHTLGCVIAVPCLECSISQMFTVSFLSFESQNKCYSSVLKKAFADHSRYLVTLPCSISPTESKTPGRKYIHAFVFWLVCPSPTT